MSEIKETVTTRNNQTVDDTGAEVRQRTSRVHRSASADVQTTLANIVWLIVGIIEMLLLARFILKLLGANPNNGFVDFIYSVSGALTAPFDNIFNVTSTSTTTGNVQSVFEPSILVAAAVYALIGWAIVMLLTLNRGNRVD